MAKLNRQDMEARYELFNHFALNDQRNYYNSTLKKYRESARQVNRLRAGAAFLTGFASAAAGLIVQSSFVSGASCAANAAGVVPPECRTLQILVYVFIVLGVAMPALGALFGTLADLYQWDRMITIYDSAVENIEFADAQSPLPEMADDIYGASLNAFTEGTLLVMQDETAQWGQSIRTPPETSVFIEKMRKRAAEIGGDAGDTTPGSST